MSQNLQKRWRRTKRFLRQLTPKQIFRENGLNKFRLSGAGILWIMAGSLVLCLSLDYFGHFELARPVMFSTGMIAIAIAFRWQLRRHLWFWITIATTIALHAFAILEHQWTTKWVPAAVSVGYMTIDLYVILVVISMVRKIEGDENEIGNQKP